MDKKELRRIIREKKRAMTVEAIEAASRRLGELFVETEEYKNAKLTTMVAMINEMVGMVTTNMTKTEILNYAVEFFPMLASSEIISQRVPFDGKHTDGKDYYYLAMIDGISVVVPHLDGIVEKLNETLS